MSRFSIHQNKETQPDHCKKKLYLARCLNLRDNGISRRTIVSAAWPIVQLMPKRRNLKYLLAQHGLVHLSSAAFPRRELRKDRSIRKDVFLKIGAGSLSDSRRGTQSGTWMDTDPIIIWNSDPLFDLFPLLTRWNKEGDLHSLPWGGWVTQIHNHCLNKRK